MRLDVYFRSCTRVESVHGSPRPLGANKMELATRCLVSLTCSMIHAVRNSVVESLNLTLIDDHSHPNFLHTIQQILSLAPFPTRLVSIDVTGNGPSLWRSYSEARYYSPELIYFVEDDYLHAPTAIAEMVEAFTLGRNGVGQDVVIFPCDYPDLYKSPQVSHVFLAQKRYWRHIYSTTGTFMITRQILEKYWNQYMDFSRYGLDPDVSESNTINLIYREVPCFSPMPSLAVHMHEGMQSAFTNWQEWWKESGPERFQNFMPPSGHEREPSRI